MLMQGDIHARSRAKAPVMRIEDRIAPIHGRDARPTSVVLHRFLEHFPQIIPVIALPRLLHQFFKLSSIDEFLRQRDFFNARNLQSLTLFQRLNELRTAQQRIVSPGIKPRDAPPHRLHAQLFLRQIRAIDVRDFEFAPSAGF
jgi:hypothetical protein